ncbi:unnamed protein product [Nezara viridula]|uniref:Uncharacterized protein n=1 Tax=Nezara viridula TaxID=85310 RepID=A0A9P0EEZ9_NEZVI|nr:unnamed protein product [Nezara viridula]
MFEYRLFSFFTLLTPLNSCSLNCNFSYSLDCIRSAMVKITKKIMFITMFGEHMLRRKKRSESDLNRLNRALCVQLVLSELSVVNYSCSLSRMNFINTLFHIIGAYLTRMLLPDVEKMVRLAVAILTLYLPLVAVGGTFCFLTGSDVEQAITSWYTQKIMATYNVFYERDEKSIDTPS